MSKSVYVVTGSEDGIQAVTGNMKRAYKIAAQYLQSTGDEELLLDNKKATYSRFVKAMNDFSYQTIERTGDRVSATVQWFGLNEYN